MKPSRTFKSLDEISANSGSSVDAEPEKLKPPKPQVLAEIPLKNPPEIDPHVPDVRGLHRWGINE